MKNKDIRLNLGCSVDLLDDYINIDNNFPNADLKHDLLKPLPFDDNTVTEILASHLLEHFNYIETAIILKDWYRVLKKGGILHIRVPDMEQVCRDYLNSNKQRRLNWAMIEIYGGQWNEGEFHKNGFDEHSLKYFVKNQGFKFKKKLEPRRKIKKYPRWEGDDIIPELNMIFNKVD
jgi:predicted SAM-dependent methyltransferase